jgi:putative heme-binding domain-containing protein
MSRSYLLRTTLCVFVSTVAGLSRPGVSTADERAEYAQYAQRTHGDPARGRRVFADITGAGCIRCHKVGNEGGSVGPDLSDIGGKLGREHLIESVLEPSRQIVEGYRPTLIATGDGRVLTGLVQGETADALTLWDARAQSQVVAKSSIEERRYADISIMPEGLTTGLSREQFADLIAYLESLRFTAKPTPGSTTSGPLVLPPGCTALKVAAGLTGATALAVAPDGRVFVCEQTGALRVVRHDRLLPAPLLTVPVDSRWERGLIGVCLDPAFEANGYIYITYVTAEPFPHHRVSRFTARGDVALPASEVVLLEGDDQRTLGGTIPAGHQGGALHFGGDGKLYVAIGEQTAGLPAQRLDTFQGKLLRINPDGSIPPDNPFCGTAQGKYRAIWALGLRNPFTFAVQAGSGRIFINDVGQNAWEEINEGFAGANYGWPAVEGSSSDPRYRAPIHAYKVASVAGGAFAPEGSGRGAAGWLPAAYRGKYFFMDFVKGWIQVLDPDPPHAVTTFATGLKRPVDLAFAPEPDGALYVLVRDAWVIDDKFRPHTGALIKITAGTEADRE